jgi:hypothetical protein
MAVEQSLPLLVAVGIQSYLEVGRRAIKKMKRPREDSLEGSRKPVRLRRIG